jgi:hypothetical protein
VSAEDRRREIEVGDTPPRLQRLILDRLSSVPGTNKVYERLDRPELAVKMRQRSRERVLVGDVGFDDDQVGVQVAERVPELRDLRLISARDRHTMTVVSCAYPPLGDEEPARA